MAEAPANPPRKRPRDERLDLFRGITMLIIFVAHVPDNSWNGYIPARFGFSSGTELFVFCSGLASAIAFGSVFLKRGLFLGTARILMRIWQVYWAHIGLVVALVGIAALIDRALSMQLLAAQFAPLTTDPAGALLGLMMLTWQPDYLDILPVYLVILALIPVMMLLRRIHATLPFALMATLYGLVWTIDINLLGNPWNGAGWFLNPFAWQLIFFIGFAFGMGWLKAPPLGLRPAMLACIVFLVVSVPLSFWAILQDWPSAQALRDAILPASEKNNLHLLRIAHFLALAYVVLSLIDPHKAHLDRGIGHLLIVIGRQSLATFLASLILARLAGVAADLMGRDAATMAAINLGGFVCILSVARVVGWFKSSPWNAPRSAPPVIAVAAPETRTARHANEHSRPPSRVREAS